MDTRKSSFGYLCFGAPLRPIVMAATSQGLCLLQFGTASMPANAEVEALVRRYRPELTIQTDDFSTLLHTAKAAVLRYFRTGAPLPPLPLDLKCGTLFQQAVWQALCRIPIGETRSYKEIAHAIGRPRATRAVGQACGKNPLAIIVPCHRVIAHGGRLGGYGGGLDIKKALLELEKHLGNST